MESKFSPGQIIHHKLFDYRGVIFDVDPKFSGTEEWYRLVARSRPPKDRPWYKVLVDGEEKTTYVAERNLELSDDTRAIRHPLIERLFDGYRDGRYLYRSRIN